MSRSFTTAAAWDTVVGVALASYCGCGVLWIYALLAENLLMIPGLAHELLVGVISSAVVGATGFSLAAWKGDALLAYFGERRRVLAWRRTGRLCSIRLHLALVQNITSLMNDSWRQQLHGLPLVEDRPATPSEWFEHQYASWAQRFEQIRRKGGTLALPPDWESLEYDEVLAVSRIPRWKPIMAILCTKLTATATTFHYALPSDLHQSILDALVELELFDEQINELESEPPHNAPAANVERAIQVFATIARFAAAHHRWFSDYLSHHPGEMWPMRSGSVRLIPASPAPSGPDARAHPPNG